MSEWYQGKIIPTDVALRGLGIDLPEVYTDRAGQRYIKAVNGYIAEEYAENPDAKRDLYMLSIPCDFIFKINLAEFAHVYKLRNKNSSASPEVKLCCEAIVDQLESFQPVFDRELLEKVRN